MSYAIEQKYFAVGKESERGTAVDATRYIPVAKDSEFEYKLNLVEDDLLRGIFERFPAVAGTKEGSGKLSGIDVFSDNIGELLLSCLGQVNTENPATGVYLHTFTKNNGTIQNPSYTIHVERGLSQKMYPLSVVKSLALKGAVDGKINADAEILFKTESAETFTLTPTWTDPTPFVFYQTTISFDDNADLETVKDWTLTIDNGSVVKRVLNNSQDIADILTTGKLTVTGGMTIFFEDENRRTKFLSGTPQKINIKAEGTTISGSYKHYLEFVLPVVKYKAYPFGESDTLLAASVTFDSYYSVASGKSIEIKLQNTISSY